MSRSISFIHAQNYRTAHCTLAMARNSARAWWGAAAALGMPAGMSTLMEATKPNGKAPEAEVVLRDPGQAAPPAASAAAGPLPDHARSSVLFGEAAGKPQKSSGGTGGVPGRGGAPSSDESKCCLGALYFSQALHDRKKGPVRPPPSSPPSPSPSFLLDLKTLSCLL